MSVARLDLCHTQLAFAGTCTDNNNNCTCYYYVCCELVLRLFLAGAYRGATQRLTSELQWDSILPCHGDYIPSGGKQILQKHLGLQH